MHLGPRAPLDEQTLRNWIVHQDADAMLRALREVPVAAGEALLVPAGTLHAIGQGILLIELQESAHLSVLLEWRRFGVSSGTEHLGLGRDAALGPISTSPLDVDVFTRATHRPPARPSRTCSRPG